MGDRTLGVVGLLLSAFYIWQATRIELSFITDPVGPRAFPILIGLMLAVASLVIVLRPDAAPAWPEAARLIEIGLAAAVMVAYTYALPAFGFIIATALASGYLCWRLGTAPVASALTGIGIALGIYLVFHSILGLSLARGPIGPWVDAAVHPIGRAGNWVLGLFGGDTSLPDAATTAPQGD
jgi:putative tricarboxylic transport membrane protein